MAAQEMAIFPRSVPSKLRSFKIRASTGKAVTLIAVPIKRAKGKNDPCSTANCWIEHFGQADAQGKWQHNADIADQNDRGPLLKNTFEINLKADHKHEKQESKLTQDRNRRQGRCRENNAKSIRKEASKKRRAEDNACCHFPHDTWLPHVLKKPAENTRCQQNGTNRKDELFSLHPIAFLNPVRYITTAVAFSPAP